jgi:hypothetical protein
LGHISTPTHACPDFTGLASQAAGELAESLCGRQEHGREEKDLFSCRFPPRSTLFCSALLCFACWACGTDVGGKARPPSVNRCCLKWNPFSQPLAGSDRGTEPPQLLCTRGSVPRLHVAPEASPPPRELLGLQDTAQLTTIGTLWADARQSPSPSLSYISCPPQGTGVGLANTCMI